MKIHLKHAFFNRDMTDNNQPSTLTVYKASAGSGKTFRLTVEYIKLLLQAPNCYKNILAVTFTNKATDEMKTRILSTLYGLCHGLESSASYLQKLTEETGRTQESVRQLAGQALHNLLHDYQHFQVQTIDKFFQHIFRNLARELNLTSNLRLEIRDKDVLQLAVDNLIDSLRTTDPEFKWLWEYIRSQLNDNKRWNIISEVKKFGEHMFKDYYKENREKIQQCLSTPHFFEQYTSHLRKIKAQELAELKEHADAFFSIIQLEGLDETDFFQKKSGIYGYFQKVQRGEINDSIVNKYCAPCFESSDSWVKRDHRKREDIITLIDNSLFDLLKAIEEKRPSYYRMCATIDATLQQLDYLRLLGSIEKRVREMNQESNRFLLSDTQGLLQQLIDDSDTPFVYEKSGTRLQHIMIDEFQDTSRVQWQNFRILLKDCMDRGFNNLIVGDVKQSIYRWRDGDWRLLAGIDKQFGNSKDMLRITSLDTNFRSRRKIVLFNNAFFRLASKMSYQAISDQLADAAQQIVDAYADTEQQVPSNKGDDGYVQVRVVSKSASHESIMQWLETEIERLIEYGVPSSKIGILARKNDELSGIARHFQTVRPEWKMISDEAFKLNFSLAVNIIIRTLRWLEHPEDELTLKALVKNYQCDILNKALTDNDLFLNTGNIGLLLPESFQDEKQQEDLRSLPLIELIEQICYAFQLYSLSGQEAYLCTFFDVVAEYIQTELGTIDDFLAAWDDHLYNTAIQSDKVDGIRLLTIHKSKGLEVANLFIPFCNWALEQVQTLWCIPEVSPFNQMPLVPVSSGKKLIDTIYKSDYENEVLQNTVDNLNLLYVAFTRAVDRLYVSTKQGAKNYRGFLVENVVQELDNTEVLQGSTLVSNDDDDGFTFEYGEPFSFAEKEKVYVADGNVFTAQQEPIFVRLESFERKAVFRQSGQSERFVNTEDEEEDERHDSYIKVGTLLHHVLSQIKTSEDVEPVLDKMMSEGLLNNTGKAAQMREMLRKRLENPKVRPWFSPTWRVHNECSIIVGGGGQNAHQEYRPDRVVSNGDHVVVIDFKFGNKNEKHRDQVLNYMSLLRDMGYTEVEGYLWYVYQNETIKI